MELLLDYFLQCGHERQAEGGSYKKTFYLAISPSLQERAWKM